MKKLFIDTTDNKETCVGLFVDGEKFYVKKETQLRSSQVVLPEIIELLKKHKLSLKDIDGIEVRVGPGSFTGVRVGVSIANALGFALGIPVNGKMGVVEAVYE